VSSIKAQLHAYCIAYVDERINTIKQEIAAAQSSAHEETKSSAGDKYETGRAMMQLEIEKNTTQLGEANKLKSALHLINPDLATESVQQGSLVTTNQGIFYLSIPVGAITLDRKNYFILSPASPIGTKMMKLKAGDQFTFNAKSYQIDRVE
jgi:transcription elongation GreA/GreB family factor